MRIKYVIVVILVWIEIYIGIAATLGRCSNKLDEAWGDRRRYGVGG
jgi:hypothetical protein